MPWPVDPAVVSMRREAAALAARLDQEEASLADARTLYARAVRRHATRPASPIRSLAVDLAGSRYDRCRRRYGDTLQALRGLDREIASRTPRQ